MIRHHILQFLRNFRRQKLFSFIILLGLTASIACSLLIYLHVRHELSYDRFHSHADRIYRINQTFIWGDNNDNQFASTGPGVAYALKTEIPEVERITSIHTPGSFIISYTQPSGEVIAFEEDRILAGDTNFFEIFDFDLLQGNERSALIQANTMVVTESTARKYFGSDNAIGKLVRLSGLGGRDNQTYEVTAVVKDLPDNSYIEFDFLLSMKGFPVERFYWSWVWTQLETYVLLREGADLASVKKRLQMIPRKHAEQTLQRVMNTTFDDYVKSGKKWELFLQPLTRIHLPEETVLNRLNDSGNLKTVYSLMGAGVVILLLACVNFMNLSTAQFTRRVREVSVRKILGQRKHQLALGFVVEAMAFCLLSMLIAVAATQWLLPQFNAITGKSLQLDLLHDRNLVLSLFIAVFSMAMLSALYPAWFLNTFNAVQAIKGKIKTGRDGKAFRNGLVVFQFTVSIVLIISTAVVFQQLDYVAGKDLGFNKENLMVLKHVEQLQNAESLREEALHIRGIESASLCTSVPPTIFGGDKFTGEGMNGASFSLNYTSSDDKYIPTLDLKLLVGRNFHKDSKADSNRVVVNEAALKTMGWPVNESVIGKKITYPNDDKNVFEVIGVISDFNYWSLESPVEPMAIFNIKNKIVFPGERQFLLLRIRPQTDKLFQETISDMRSVWKKHAADSPFDYTFVDEVFADSFKSREQFGKVLTVLALMAMVIATLGLLGMIMYSLEQRMKEIGIRKVSGASIENIVFMISRDYIKLVIIAFVIAAPLAWWLMEEWLEDFAYRITQPFVWFLLSGVFAVLVALLITGYHSVCAARMNPVDVLRDE